MTLKEKETKKNHFDEVRDNLTLPFSFYFRNISSKLFAIGTVGEFLVNAACVAEQRNYKLLMSVLDKFECESGMRINVSKEGLVIPLGPDLQATLNISLRP